MRASLAERCCSLTIGRHAPGPASRDFFFPSWRPSVRLRKSPTDADRRAARASMEPRDELLKSIWHAFTALDVDQSGKVSKSQLKVLSHNLCTVMRIPHDPVALEEHFKDDDEGPVSNQGYMPYLNRFILDKVRARHTRPYLPDLGRTPSKCHNKTFTSVVRTRPGGRDPGGTCPSMDGLSPSCPPAGAWSSNSSLDVMKPGFIGDCSEALRQLFEFHFSFHMTAPRWSPWKRCCSPVPLHWTSFSFFKSVLQIAAFPDPRLKPVLVVLQVTVDFDRQEFHKMCWTLCSRKNLNQSKLMISSDDAFKVWCIFNFLSDDQYPLVIITEEVSDEQQQPFVSPLLQIEYFLRKLTEAMGGSWVEERFEDYKMLLNARQQSLSAWELISLVGSGHFSKGMDKQTLSMGINEVYLELILDVLKQGYMMKKGHKRKNWNERWFVLKPNSMSYYVSEDLAEWKGDILLDEYSAVAPLQDKDGKKCLFLIKSAQKSFEISVSDKKKKQEWIQAIQTCLNRLRDGRPAPHREAQQKRREIRLRRQEEQEELELRMRELQVANEAKQLELEKMRRLRLRRPEAPAAPRGAPASVSKLTWQHSGGAVSPVRSEVAADLFDSGVVMRSLASVVASADGVRVEQPTGSNRSPLSGQQSATVATDRRTMTVQSERRRSSPGMSRRRGELSADTELRQLAAGWRVSDHKHADELERSQGSEVKRAELSHDRVSPQALEEAAANAAEEEQRRLQTQTELQDRYRTDLEKEILVRQQIEEQVAQKSTELEQYLVRVRELEDMYRRLEEALEDERARPAGRGGRPQAPGSVGPAGPAGPAGPGKGGRSLNLSPLMVVNVLVLCCSLRCSTSVCVRLLEEEATKRVELEQLHLHQQRTISETEAEKQELQKERVAKENALQAAMEQLEHLEKERQGALEQYQEVVKKLETATNNTKSWKHKVAEHEGLLRLIEPGSKGPVLITNWGPAAFSDAELSHREKQWQKEKSEKSQAQ
ncbi:Switch-associated protein 70 [Takifugu flavidus]|uniref:Switch-associated protein 70 n=1 Tax=Takifugu flavidus TaxID=433684 RepID=A0A5C6P8D7_9TELE|nr:Switch-associated protein 70 [Takifugu flavidus]